MKLTLVGVSVNDFLSVLNDLKVTVSYYAVTRAIDGIYGSETPTYASPVSKSWIFLKHGSKIDLTKYGIVDKGDAYLFFPFGDTLVYGDKIAINSETFQYTPDCFSADRYANGVHMYKYYTVNKIS